MKALVCELCGSNEFVKEDGYFVCQHCHTKYSPEEAKKIMVEGTVDVSGSTVKVDSSDELRNLYELARRARDTDNSEEAAKYYEMIKIKDPSSWEAAFYSVYFKALSCNIINITSSANNLQNIYPVILKMINDSDSNKELAVCEVIAHTVTACWLLYQAARNHFDKFFDTDGASSEFSNNLLSCNTACVYCSKIPDSLEVNAHNSETVKRSVIFACETAQKMIVDAFDLFFAHTNGRTGVRESFQEHIDIIERDYIKPLQENHVKPELKATNQGNSSGGCYIATAVYGSYDCPEVWTLRRFRDYMLAETWYGRTLINTYYAISPTLVKWFGKTEWFKNLWKPMLDRLVQDLQNKGVENGPYQDKEC